MRHEQNSPKPTKVQLKLTFTKPAPAKHVANAAPPTSSVSIPSPPLPAIRTDWTRFLSSDEMPIRISYPKCSKKRRKPDHSGTSLQDFLIRPEQVNKSRLSRRSKPPRNSFSSTTSPSKRQRVLNAKDCKSKPK